mmetsp:Transcript_2104/g.6066  ORF Transcript_2104/g.6066 Transcript_2104/m.6066 type:complete len:360 (-) Transcript_2104:92-1171(-)
MPSQIAIIPSSIQVPVDRQKYRRSTSQVSDHIDEDDISSLGAPSTTVPRHQPKKKASSQINHRPVRNEINDDKDMRLKMIEAEMANIKLVKMLREAQKTSDLAASKILLLQEEKRVMAAELEERAKEVALLEEQLDNEQVRRLSVSSVEASLRIRIAELEAENARQKKSGVVKNLVTAPVDNGRTCRRSIGTEKTVSFRTANSEEEQSHQNSLTKSCRQKSEKSLNSSAGTLDSIFEDKDGHVSININGALEAMRQLEEGGEECIERAVNVDSSNSVPKNKKSASDILSRSLTKQSTIPGRKPRYTKRSSSLPMIETNSHRMEKNNTSTAPSDRAERKTHAVAAASRRTSLPLDLADSS